MANSSFVPIFYLLPDHCFSGFKVCYPPFEYSTEAITTCFQTVNIYFKVQYVFTGSSRPFAWSFQHKKSPWARPRAIRVCVWKDHVSQQGILIHDLLLREEAKPLPMFLQGLRRVGDDDLRCLQDPVGQVPQVLGATGPLHPSCFHQQACLGS